MKYIILFYLFLPFCFGDSPVTELTPEQKGIYWKKNAEMHFRLRQLDLVQKQYEQVIEVAKKAEAEFRKYESEICKDKEKAVINEKSTEVECQLIPIETKKP